MLQPQKLSYLLGNEWRMVVSLIDEQSNGGMGYSIAKTK